MAEKAYGQLIELQANWIETSHHDYLKKIVQIESLTEENKILTGRLNQATIKISELEAVVLELKEELEKLKDNSTSTLNSNTTSISAISTATDSQHQQQQHLQQQQHQQEHQQILVNTINTTAAPDPINNQTIYSYPNYNQQHHHQESLQQQNIVYSPYPHFSHHQEPLQQPLQHHLDHSQQQAVPQYVWYDGMQN